jgi:hypothetical protein
MYLYRVLITCRHILFYTYYHLMRVWSPAGPIKSLTRTVGIPCPWLGVRDSAGKAMGDLKNSCGSPVLITSSHGRRIIINHIMVSEFTPGALSLELKSLVQSRFSAPIGHKRNRTGSRSFQNPKKPDRNR